MRNTFVFNSNQSHTVIKNGKRFTRRNNVSVSGNKGSKEVQIVKPGKKAKKTRKALTKREISNIRKGVFMPSLFRGIV
jgi:hypothetical protein